MTGHPTKHADTRNGGAERILIVSDIHSNIEALEACLADARARGGFTRCWNIGDTVGYGPDPVAVLDALRAIDVPVLSVKGNHDRTSVRDLLWAQPEYYHRQADYLNWRAMSDADRTVLRAWPEEVIDLGFRIVHDPGRQYVTTAWTANEVLTKTNDATHVAVGHSHDPGYFVSESAPANRCGADRSCRLTTVTSSPLPRGAATSSTRAASGNRAMVTGGRGTSWRRSTATP